MFFTKTNYTNTIRRVLGVGTAVIVAAGSTFTGALVGVQPVAAAAGDQIYWGAYIDGAPNDVSKIDTFETRANKRVSLEMFGTPWQMNGKDMPFPTAYMNTIRNRGTVPVLDWGSDALGYGVNQPNFTLASITNGSHDAYITQWAQAAAAWNHPFFLRFDAEMNGWWLPWSEQTNGNQPGDFVRAWRHVVDIFRAQGANNVTWVWCPNIVGSQSTPLSGLYPGDNYVDWTATDGYNYGTDRNNKPQSFNQIFGYSTYNGGYNTYQLLQTLAPTKPIMIAETASSETGGPKAAWITDAFSSQLQTNFPLVKAVMWFDWNDNDTNLSWPIESSATAQSAFATAIQSSYFATNEFAGLSGSGPIQPLPSTGTPPTATPVPPTPTATLVPPTATATATAIPPTATATATGIPPTATATATAIPPTATAVPPTATAVPPTPTSVPATATPIPPALPSNGASLTSIADTFISRAAPSSVAGGSSTELRVDMTGSDTSIMKFDLSAAAGKTITSAKLRFKTSSEAWATTASTVTVRYVDDTGWWEKYMSYKNTVPISSTITGTLKGAPLTNTWYEIPLDRTVLQRSAGRLVSMALQGSSSDVLIMYSREAGAANAPQLIVTY